MTETNAGPVPELEDILQRLESAKAGLIDAIESSSADSFAKENAAGESVKKTLERAADEVNFYYGRLVSKALNLPQPPGLVEHIRAGGVVDAIAPARQRLFLEENLELFRRT